MVNELDNAEPKLVKKATFEMLLPASMANNLSNNKNGIPSFQDIRSYVELRMHPKNSNFIEFK